MKYKTTTTHINEEGEILLKKHLKNYTLLKTIKEKSYAYSNGVYTRHYTKVYRRKPKQLKFKF